MITSLRKPSELFQDSIHAKAENVVLQVLRVLRLVRVFRVLKFGQHFQKMHLVGQALSVSSDVIIMLSFLLVLCMLVFSALVYEAENGVRTTWSPVTDTTVRYPRHV
jgi:voltage-gated potassium channel